MKQVVSTHLFRRQRLGAAGLDLLAEAGLDALEIFCSRASFDYHDRAQMVELAAWFHDHRLQIHSLHSPIYADENEGRAGAPPLDIADADHRLRLAALDEVQRALEFRERVEFRYLVQHLGPPRAEWDAHRADRALTSLERIRLLAKQADVAVLVENIPNGLSQPERLLAFLQQNHLKDIGVCFDSGHANLGPESFGGGGVEATWGILGPRVQSTHLHDNGGDQDDHLWPGDGTVAWEKLMPRLASREDVAWVLEVREAGESNTLAQRLRDAFARLHHLAEAASPAQ